MRLLNFDILAHSEQELVEFLGVNWAYFLVRCDLCIKIVTDIKYLYTLFVYKFNYKIYN